MILDLLRDKMTKVELKSKREMLYEWSEKDEDFFVQQNLWSMIGWINCLLTHNIKPSNKIVKDLEALTEIYNKTILTY